MKSANVFGKKAYPNQELFAAICKHTEEACRDNGVQYYIGRTFSIDTIAAQFAHIDSIIGMGCNVIEMETAAAFRAARLADISLAAIFSVSDNTITNKSLVSGRTEQEMAYRRLTRKKLSRKSYAKDLRRYEHPAAGQP